MVSNCSSLSTHGIRIAVLPSKLKVSRAARHKECNARRLQIADHGDGCSHWRSFDDEIYDATSATLSRSRILEVVDFAAMNTMRSLVVMIFSCFVLCEAGIAQTTSVLTPNLQETLLWMNHFSRDHGFFNDDHGVRISNQFLSKGCDATVEVFFPNSRTSKANIRKRTEDVKLAELNPKVTLQTGDNEQTVEVYFETANAQIKIHETMEYGDGAKLQAWVTSETMYFDLRGSAIRFARAFSRAITLCSEQAQRWVSLYQLALLELDPSKMATRLLDARHEIFNRIEELRDLPGPHDRENRAFQDALSNIRSLHKEQQEWTAKQARRIG
jgi:hypothetical protein